MPSGRSELQRCAIVLAGGGATNFLFGIFAARSEPFASLHCSAMSACGSPTTQGSSEAPSPGHTSPTDARSEQPSEDKNSAVTVSTAPFLDHANHRLPTIDKKTVEKSENMENHLQKSAPETATAQNKFGEAHSTSPTAPKGTDVSAGDSKTLTIAELTQGRDVEAPSAPTKSENLQLGQSLAKSEEGTSSDLPHTPSTQATVPNGDSNALKTPQATLFSHVPAANSLSDLGISALWAELAGSAAQLQQERMAQLQQAQALHLLQQHQLQLSSPIFSMGPLVPSPAPHNLRSGSAAASLLAGASSPLPAGVFPARPFQNSLTDSNSTLASSCASIGASLPSPASAPPAFALPTAPTSLAASPAAGDLKFPLSDLSALNRPSLEPLLSVDAPRTTSETSGLMRDSTLPMALPHMLPPYSMPIYYHHPALYAHAQAQLMSAAQTGSLGSLNSPFLGQVRLADLGAGAPLLPGAALGAMSSPEAHAHLLREQARFGTPASAGAFGQLLTTGLGASAQNLATDRPSLPFCPPALGPHADSLQSAALAHRTNTSSSQAERNNASVSLSFTVSSSSSSSHRNHSRTSTTSSRQRQNARMSATASAAPTYKATRHHPNVSGAEAEPSANSSCASVTDMTEDEIHATRSHISSHTASTSDRNKHTLPHRQSHILQHPQPQSHSHAAQHPAGANFDSFVYRNRGSTIAFSDLSKAAALGYSPAVRSERDGRPYVVSASSHATRISSLADEGIAWDESLCDVAGRLPTDALSRPNSEDWFHSWQLNRRVAAKWLHGIDQAMTNFLLDLSKYYACNFEGSFLEFYAPEVPSTAILNEFLRLGREHAASSVDSDANMIHVVTSYFNCSSRKRAAPECGAKLNTQLWFDATNMEFFESIEGAKKSNSKNLHSAACRACHKSRLPPSVSTLRVVDRLLATGHSPSAVEEMVRSQAIAKTGGAADDGRLLATAGTIFNRQRKVRSEQSKKLASPHQTRWRKTGPTDPETFASAQHHLAGPYLPSTASHSFSEALLGSQSSASASSTSSNTRARTRSATAAASNVLPSDLALKILRRRADSPSTTSTAQPATVEGNDQSSDEEEALETLRGWQRSSSASSPRSAGASSAGASEHSPSSPHRFFDATPPTSAHSHSSAASQTTLPVDLNSPNSKKRSSESPLPEYTDSPIKRIRLV